MNKYFWVWLWSCIFYAMGITTIVMSKDPSVLSVGYISNEVFQISALICIFYACNLIDNIPHNFFAIKYGAIFIIFFVVYGVIYSTNQTIYIVMLLFKLLAVIMTVYTIVVKWRFELLIKAASITILSTGGLFLSLYDFFVYGSSTHNDEAIIYVCIGVLFLVFQNFDFAVLYRIQTRNQEKLRGDYLTIFAENSADIIFYYTINPYPRFAFVSPASSVLLGYSPQDFYGNNKLHVELTVEDDREKMETIFSDFPEDTNQCVVQVERRDGETVNLECYATKVKVNGKVVAVEGILRDITERVEAERKIVENNKNRQLMLSYISHDLKTPITYISGYSQAILNNVIKSEEERMDAVRTIYNKSNSLTKLVEDISLLSKLEASRFNYSFEAIKCVDLADHIRQQHLNDFCSTDKDYRFVDRDYRFEIDSNITAEASVLADVKRIDQVFDNLLSNALKATEDGGKIDIFCGLSKQKQFYISVIDDGAGIASDDLPHIFENFYRSPESKRRQDGSGLGLSLSKQIARGHGGDLYAESEQGEGTRMTLVLPLFQQEA